MWSLLSKEISEFFSTITGYVVVVVFLLANSLFLWIFPGDTNVLDSGYASLDTFFMMAPWIFLFLVPAVTMRSFAEENRSGTLELLFTRPLTDIQIVLGKYFAGLLLVLVSLVPTLVYVLSVWMLGNPPGNLDLGGVWGSYIGLFFLALVYVAIGIFSSSLTDNPIVAFIVAVLLSFVLYIGFDFLSSMDTFQQVNFLVIKIGINEHYKSMSRGVIDSRDILYFLGVIALFLWMTRFVLQSRRW
jgi:ABC-2 type transport system permease protein